MSRSLPPELWLDIFSLAVHVPRLFDTKWNYSPDELIWEGGWAKMDTMERESFNLRKATVRVSREWRILGRPFLYEDLVVNKRTAVENLATLFEQSGSSTSAEDNNGRNNGDEVGYGRWVRRVSIQGDHWFEGNAFSSLERLLRRCSNVQIILLDAPYKGTYFPQVSQLFQSLHAQSLRRVTITRLPFNGVPNHLFQHSNAPVSLDWAVLQSSWILRMFPNANNSLSPTSLSNLAVLEVTNNVMITDFPSWDLPNLRYFSIMSLSNAEIPVFIPFMEANGHRMLGLSFRTAENCPSLHRFLEYTPVLQSLVFDDIDLDIFRPSDSSYPSITHIGLANTRYEDTSDAGRIRTGLDYILRCNLFPNLRTVRILNGIIPPRIEGDWEQSIATAAQYGVRLEDRDKHILRFDPA